MINSYSLLFILSVFISSVSQIMLKKATEKKHESIIEEYINKYVVIGYGFLVISSLLTSIAYRGVDLSFGPIYNSLGYILVGGMSYFILKESLTKKKILGYALIVLGVIICSLSKI